MVNGNKESNVNNLYSAMLKDGKVDETITIDGVHFNKQGYSIWEKVLKNHLPGNDVIAATSPMAHKLKT